MSAATKLLGLEQDEQPLRDAFLGWQCRVRQLLMREEYGRGRPSPAIIPELTLKGTQTAFGAVITLLNKKPQFSMLPEIQHMARSTADPAQRRDKAIQFFSATYYQKAHEFSDLLTSSFTPNSPGAKQIRQAEFCRLDFSAYNQSYSLYCKVWQLTPKNPFHAATWWHNHLFNPNLPSDAVILGFEPDWDRSSPSP